ncbi:MAG: hypothetical protein ACTSSJ_00140 [Candidatus Odinarchaeia archaeon]
MPLGVVLIKWDNKSGGIIEAKYSPKAWVPPTLPNTVLSMHFPGMKVDKNAVKWVKTKIGKLKLCSYFIQTVPARVIALLLDVHEDSEKYKNKIIDFANSMVKEPDSTAKELAKFYRSLEK